MSIVKMKHLRLFAMAADREELLRQLQHLGCVEIREPDQELSDPAWAGFARVDDTALADTKAKADRLRAALDLLNHYAPAKSSMFQPRPLVSEAQLFDESVRQEATEAAGRISDLETRIAAIYNEQSKLTAQKASLAPWLELDADLDIPSTREVTVTYGAVSGNADRNAVETALELGPGWGNYTLDLARLCREVACVDISRDVLDFILRIGEEQGCRNIRTFHEKWEDFVPGRTYDLVFGYNCFYRQADLAGCFARMDAAAGKLCVAGMNTGLAPAWVRELDAAGGRVSWEWKDYIYFVGVLYQMGIDANVVILPFEKELCYPDADALVRGECARCAPGAVDGETARAILCRHFTQRPDGSWRANVKYRSGVVWWTPVHRD